VIKNKRYIIVLGSLLFVVIFILQLKTRLTDGTGLKNFYFKIESKDTIDSDVQFYTLFNSSVPIISNGTGIYSFAEYKRPIKYIIIKDSIEKHRKYYYKHDFNKNWIEINDDQISVKNNEVQIDPNYQSKSLLPYYDNIFNGYGDLIVVYKTLVELLFLLFFIVVPIFIIYNKEQNTQIIFTLYLLFYLIVFFCLNNFYFIRFDANDDVIMALISSGAYGGVPNFHLVFINSLIGYFISFLYHMNNKIEWYSVLMVVIHIISVTFIALYLTKVKITKFLKIGFLLLLSALFIRTVVLLQFTTTAAFATLAGLFIIHQGNRLVKCMGLIMFLLGAGLRFEAAILVLIVFCIVYFPFNRYFLKYLSRKSTYYLIAAVILSLVIQVIDKNIYNANPEWAQYQKFNKLRGKINDNPNKSIIPSDNQSLIYKDKLVRSFLIDPYTISNTDLEHILVYIAKGSFRDKLSNFVQLKSYLFLLFLFFLIGISLNLRKGKTDLIIFSLKFLFFGLILFFITLEGTLKYRVFLTASIPFLITLPLTLKKDELKNRFIITSILSFCLCYLLVRDSLVISDKTKDVREKVFAVEKTIIKDYTKDKKQIVRYGDSYRIQYNPIFSISNDFVGDHFMFLSWLAKSPMNSKKISSFEYFINGGGLYIDNSLHNYKDVTSFICSYVSLHYQITLMPLVVFQSGDYVIIEFIKV
jgi:hypothetical protein